MPLSERDLLEASAVARAYGDAEARILMRLAAYVSHGVDAPSWETDVLGRLQRLREEAIADLRAADARAADAMQKNVARLYESGGNEMLRDIGRDIAPEKIATGTMRNAVKRISSELANVTQSAGQALLRSVDDTFRSVVGEVVQSVTARGESKRDAMKRASKTLLSKGIEFRDSRGRRWNIQDYTNMAVRTGYANAQIQGHEDALDAAGLDLVIIQPGPRACPICDHWARMVLSRGGQTGTYYATNALTGKNTSVKIDDTLDNARAQGFQHPNCRCSLRAFIPGVTSRSEIKRPPYDAEGYERQQQQRSIERGIRAAKIELATAQTSGDPKAIAAARAKIAKRQSQLRDHLAANPYLKRRSDREQIIRSEPGDAIPTTPKTPRKPRTPVEPKIERVVEKVREEVRDETPDSETALMQRFRRLAKSESVDEIVKRSNPGGNVGGILAPDKNYRTNCHYVVAAVEMRARGYDVVARPTIGSLGRYNAQIEGDWEGGRQFTSLKGSPAADGKSIVGWIEHETAGMPVGARGVISGAWARGGGGHIFNWERTEDGVVFHEGQIHTTNSHSARSNALSLKRDSVAIMRIDDLTPSQNALNALQSPSEFLLDGERRLRNEIKRVEEIIATLQADLDRLNSRIGPDRAILDAYEEWEALRKRYKSRATSVDEKVRLINRLAELGAIWNADRAAVTRAVNARAGVTNQEKLISKWRGELRRLKKALKDLG